MYINVHKFMDYVKKPVLDDPQQMWAYSVPAGPTLAYTALQQLAILCGSFTCNKQRTIENTAIQLTHQYINYNLTYTSVHKCVYILIDWFNTHRELRPLLTLSHNHRVYTNMHLY